MTDVVQETREHLAALAAKHPDAPRKQMDELYLLGVEREQIVAVAYREDTLRDRIEALEVDDQVKDLVRHAMRWIWKEEQMHTMFIRGSLLKSGRPLLRVQAFVRQLAGAIAGWATSVLHHVRWTQAPLSRFWAHVFTFLGFLAGKVPTPILSEMRHVSFYDYCRFSLMAEKTAALCWERVAELADEAGEPPEVAAPFTRMGADERNHERIFELFLEALGEDDRLAAGWSHAAMVERLTAIGPFYLPPAHRPDAATMPLGRGGAVVVHQAGPDDTLEDAMRATLEAADLAALLEERAAACGKPVTELRVAIKATFMRGYSTRDKSSYVDPRLVSAVVTTLRKAGCAEVCVLEAASIYDWYFADRDVAAVARYLGYAFDDATVVDVEADVAPHPFARGMAAIEVATSWREADVRIAFGKLTSHPVDQFYLAFSQLESIGARAYELVFVEKQASRGQGVAALAGACPPHFALIDAHESCADGLLGIIAGPNPKSPRRLYAGRDTLAVDAVAARHIGEDPADSPVLADAMQWFDDPRERIEVVGCDEPIEGWRSPTHNEWSAILSLLSLPVYMLLSGRGSLFVPEMDPQAFPPLEPPSWPLRTARRFLRWMLGMRLPKETRPPKAS